MQAPWLLMLAVLVAASGVPAGAAVVGSASTRFLEFSVGKFRYFELSRLFPKEAILRHISTNVTFLLFQVHSQYQNTTLSFSKVVTLTANDKTEVSFSSLPGQGVIYNVIVWDPSLNTSAAYVPVHTYACSFNAVESSCASLDPIPGGCNLEFDLDIDPNIYLEYNFFEMTIKFAPANVGFARGVAPPPCDTDEGEDLRWRLQYDVYQYFLPENDLTEDALLQHLQRMAQVPEVRANAVKLLLNLERRVSTRVFFSLSALLGLFICFFGHRFWKTELFFIGFIFLGFFFYILIARLTSMKYDVLLVLTALAGSIGGVFLVAAWWRFGILMFCMLCVGLVLGFLTSCIMFFTPLGNLKVFRDDGVFWVTFSCIAILIPVVFMGCLRILNILTCGIIGSYSVVLAIGSYVFTSLSSITLNVLRRALNADFNKAFTNVPFQTNDFVVLAIWGMLAVSGITLQIRRERGQPFFPPHPYKLWKQERERRVTNILDPSHHIPPLRNRFWGQLTQIKEFFQKQQPAGERTPLLL
ncbi:PREDICTED: transmembrane 7 superfamily member 3 [Dipodomys ordii]|uniref:Transmembrane 7 superfamily member 3 n=1 Tax=Dipodomys ordii TaxID=10020 RepID=A0A1S3GJ76_DIPOR|nr:PREDICTED: transmembrane 7 superfamily member 3 [Dipodomys ordii]